MTAVTLTQGAPSGVPRNTRCGMTSARQRWRVALLVVVARDLAKNLLSLRRSVTARLGYYGLRVRPPRRLLALVAREC